jgi:hypothetical protein
MISSAASKLVEAVQCTFADVGLKFPAHYHPDLPAFHHYSQNARVRDMMYKPNGGEVHLGKIMYSLAPPKTINRSNNVPGHENLLITPKAGVVLPTSNVTTTDLATTGPEFFKEHDKIVDAKTGVEYKLEDFEVRPISFLEVPINFLILQESSELLYEMSMIFFSEIIHIQALGLNLRFNDTAPKTAMNYQVKFDPDSLDIIYNNLDEDRNSLHQLSFSASISGGFVSSYFKGGNDKSYKFITSRTTTASYQKEKKKT